MYNMLETLAITSLADLAGDIGMVLIAALFFLAMWVAVELFERI